MVALSLLRTDATNVHIGGGAIASCTGVGPGIFRNITLKKVTFNPNDKRREGTRKDDANNRGYSHRSPEALNGNFQSQSVQTPSFTSLP